MNYKLRLSRKVIDKGKYSRTVPYDDLDELRDDYKDSSARIAFNEDE